MQSVRCEACSKETPRRNAFRVFDRVLCETCAEADVGARHDVPPESVVRLSDPTVCAQCGHDNGAAELATIAQLPVCEACEQRLRNRAFPAWVTLSLGVIVVLTIVALVKNARFFDGYIAGARAAKAAARGDVDRAAALYASALAAVPEERGYDTMQKFLSGVAMMRDDRWAEAVPLLEQASQHAPNDPLLRTTLLQAQMGEAFDAKNYQAMAEYADRLLATQPASDELKYMVASAQACVYASTGDKAALKRALDLIPKHAEHDAYKPEQRKYFNRIEHRLVTREIITREEFDRRYPHGWKPEPPAK